MVDSKWRRNIDAPYQKEVPTTLPSMSNEQRRETLIAISSRHAKNALVDLITEMTQWQAQKSDSAAAVMIFITDIHTRYLTSLQGIQGGHLLPFDVEMVRELEHMIKATNDHFIEAYGPK